MDNNEHFAASPAIAPTAEAAHLPSEQASTHSLGTTGALDDEAGFGDLFGYEEIRRSAKL